MATPFVRLYDLSHDFDNGLNVFYTTIDPTLNHEPTRTIGSYLWYRAYVSLSPSTCIVLDDGSGRVVGYCIGCADTASFMQRWRDDFAPAAEKNLPLPPATDEMSTGFRNAVLQGECSMLLSWKDVLAAYSAHLHIDILPEFQQRGYGRELMGAFLEKVKNEGAEGVHLDMVRHNVGARRFYEKLGFEACPVVMDEGASGEVGVQGVVVTLVRKL